MVNICIISKILKGEIIKTPWFTAKQIQALTVEQIRILTQKQIPVFSEEQIKNSQQLLLKKEKLQNEFNPVTINYNNLNNQTLVSNNKSNSKIL